MAAQSKAFGNMVSDWVNGYGKPEGDARLKAFSTSHKARGISKDQVGVSCYVYVLDLSLLHVLFCGG